MKVHYAQWDAPPQVKALSTTRETGVSAEPFASNNLAFHVGDCSKHVAENREALQHALQLPSSPEWLEQTHSTQCVVVEEDSNRQADAAITRKPNTVLSIMTADCLPIILTNRQGSEVAAIHAGWKGLANGIVENTVGLMHSLPQDLIAWCGPAICERCFEVGSDVLSLYNSKYPFAHASFTPHGDQYLANLSKLAHDILKQLSVSQVFQSHQCTYENKNAYYSYRRDQKTGRIATLIWINKE